MIYIVNPSYRFLKDKNRVILHSVDRINDNHSEISFWGIIHPLHAQMFSFFNGENNLENVCIYICACIIASLCCTLKTNTYCK